MSTPPESSSRRGKKKASVSFTILYSHNAQGEPVQHFVAKKPHSTRPLPADVASRRSALIDSLTRVPTPPSPPSIDPDIPSVLIDYDAIRDSLTPAERQKYTVNGMFPDDGYDYSQDVVSSASPSTVTSAFGIGIGSASRLVLEEESEWLDGSAGSGSGSSGPVDVGVEVIEFPDDEEYQFGDDDDAGDGAGEKEDAGLTAAEFWGEGEDVFEDCEILVDEDFGDEEGEGEGEGQKREYDYPDEFEGEEGGGEEDQEYDDCDEEDGGGYEDGSIYDIFFGGRGVSAEDRLKWSAGGGGQPHEQQQQNRKLGGTHGKKKKQIHLRSLRSKATTDDKKRLNEVFQGLLDALDDDLFGDMDGFANRGGASGGREDDTDDPFAGLENLDQLLMMGLDELESGSDSEEEGEEGDGDPSRGVLKFEDVEDVLDEFEEIQSQTAMDVLDANHETDGRVSEKVLDKWGRNAPAGMVLLTAALKRKLRRNDVDRAQIVRIMLERIKARQQREEAGEVETEEEEGEGDGHTQEDTGSGASVASYDHQPEIIDDRGPRRRKGSIEGEGEEEEEEGEEDVFDKLARLREDEAADSAPLIPKAKRAKETSEERRARKKALKKRRREKRRLKKVLKQTYATELTRVRKQAVVQGPARTTRLN